MHARRAHHTPLSRSVGSCMQLPFCMHGGQYTRHPRAHFVLACTAGTPHATLALSWFLHARRAHHTPLSRSVGFCMQLLFCMHGGHTTRHPRPQLVHASTGGTPHATLALSWFMHAVAFLHARRAHHTPLSRSVGSCMQLVFACTAGTPHATLALSWFLHVQLAHHTPLSGSGRSHAQRVHHVPLQLDRIRTRRLVRRNDTWWSLLERTGAY